MMIQIMMIQTMTTQIMTTKPIQYRHEFKHQLNAVDDYILTQRLKQLFKHDSHGIYRVSSLYFDTASDRALREKINGVNLREKFRIRYYNDNLLFIKLEKKSKSGGLGHKQSALLTLTQVKGILSGDYESIMSSSDPLISEFYYKIRTEGLVPKKIVTYDREAFIYAPGNCRLTMDRNLRTSLSYHQFLDPKATLYNISNKITIFEVKYDHYLPDIVRMAIQVKNRSSAAFSKYAASRMYE